MIGGLLAATHAAVSGSSIAMPHIRYLGIIPVIVLLGGAVVMLGACSVVRRPVRARVGTVGMLMIGATALALSIWQWTDVQSHGAYTTVDKAVVVDGFSAFVAILLSCAVILTALVGDGYLRREGIDGAEYHVLALVSASGAMLMGQANDLIIVFLGLEILSIALYVLAAFNRRSSASAEGALKYFLLGGFSSAIFVYGIALTYGATGTTNLTQIADFLARNVVASDGLLLAGMTLLLVGFAFKVAAVPFHMWTPDVYQGSPSPVVGFMAGVAKVGGFAAFLRVFISSFGLLRADWRPVVYVIAVLTLLVGAALALVQRDIKRMLAYSSINHAGFVLLGLQAASGRGVSAALYYLFAYTVMVIGTFAVVTYVGRAGDTGHDITAYRGLAARQPVLAFAFAILLLAQAGAPFTTGFLAKLQVIVAAADANSIPLAVVAMVSAAVAAFFYLRVAVLMYSGTRGAVAGAADGRGAARVGDDGGVRAGSDDDVRVPAGGSGWFAPGGEAQVPLWAGSERAVAVTTRLNDELLLQDDDPAGGGARVEHDDESAFAPAAVHDPAATAPVTLEDQRVVVPALAAAGIAVCVAVTVVFGVIPGPLVDFAHHAVLLFLP